VTGRARLLERRLRRPAAGCLGAPLKRV
jgi:hypothetical protein